MGKKNFLNDGRTIDISLGIEAHFDEAGVRVIQKDGMVWTVSHV